MIEVTDSLTFQDNYAVEGLVAESSFSSVYSVIERSSGKKKAVKVAATKASRKKPGGDIGSNALMMVTGGPRGVFPDNRQLLENQYRQLRAVQCKHLIFPEKLVKSSDCYFEMPFIEGVSLRDKIKNKTVSPTLLLELVEALGKLSTTGFSAHGDLNPGNILMSADGPVLLDPGYWGEIETDCGLQDCIITTPGYYPTLKPDDVLAVGFIIWEAVLGQHPLSPCSATPQSAAEPLREFINQKSLVGQHFLEPLLTLQLPTKLNTALCIDDEEFLLKCLRLRKVGDNKIDLAKGFGSFAELADSLRTLCAQKKQ